MILYKNGLKIVPPTSMKTRMKKMMKAIPMETISMMIMGSRLEQHPMRAKQCGAIFARLLRIRHSLSGGEKESGICLKPWFVVQVMTMNIMKMRTPKTIPLISMMIEGYRHEQHPMRARAFGTPSARLPCMRRAVKLRWESNRKKRLPGSDLCLALETLSLALSTHRGT